MSTHDTAAQVHSVLWCAKIRNRTCTHGTHFGGTVGLPVPVLNPTFTNMINLNINNQLVLNKEPTLTLLMWDGSGSEERVVRTKDACVAGRAIFVCITV